MITFSAHQIVKLQTAELQSIQPVADDHSEHYFRANVPACHKSLDLLREFLHGIEVKRVFL